MKSLLPYLAAALPLAADPFEKVLIPLLDEHCFHCHDDVEKSGGVSFEEIFTVEDALADPELMLKMRDVLHHREMPPEDEDQPSLADQRVVIDWINQTVLRHEGFHGERDPGAPALRRLTRLEYNNSLRDLLGLEGLDAFSFPERLMPRRDYFDPSVERMPDELNIFIPEFGSKKPVLVKLGSVPGDSRAAHGFNNQGDKLDINPFRMERYVELARELVGHEDLLVEARAIAPLFGREPAPRVERSRGASGGAKVLAATLKPEFAPLDNIASEAPGSSDKVEFFRDHIVSAFNEGLGGTFQNPDDKGVLAGASGGYVRAAAGKRAIRIKPSIDLWFVDFGTAHETSQPSNIANKHKFQKEFSIDFEVESARKDEGITSLGLVMLSRSKGSGGPVRLTARFAGGGERRLEDELATGAGEDNTFFSWQAPPGDAIVGLDVDGSDFRGEFILMDDLAFILGRSPVLAEAEQRAPNPEPGGGGDAAESADPVESAFRKFLTRAFRSPVGEEDFGIYWGFYQQGLESGLSREQAMAETIKGVLSSPRFLYRVEDAVPEAGPVRPLDGFELANRLSYFLWASMPDEELFLSAASGALAKDPAELESQVRRMLRDPKAKELSDSFAYQWLQLNKLVGAQPDRQRYKDFYAGPKGKSTMASSLMMESQLLFETVLIENRPLIDLIDPDFTWLNPRMIEYYGLEDEYAEQLESARTVDKRGRPRLDNGRWFRVELPDRSRGGVLAMGSSLTLTSLPLRSSPVYRGAWINEVVFNRPPPPPPADVDELGEDPRQFTEVTLREKLEMHRDKAACAGCHSRIDPPGFALEGFDAIGRVREEYVNGDPVDATGILKRELEFDGIVGFKDAVRERQGDFHRGFIRHLLTYALGRHLTAADQWTVDELEEVAEDGGLKDLIVAVAKSYPFTHTRNVEGGAH